MKLGKIFDLMKKIIVLLAASLAFSLTQGVAAPVFQVRLVLDDPSADSEVMSIVSQSSNSEAPAIKLNVQETVLIDETAIKSAKEVTRKVKLITGQYFLVPQIEIQLSAAGRKLFATVTGQNIGKKLAILIDGRLYCAPTMRAPITGGKVVVNGSFSEADAKALAADINAACSK